MPAIRPAGRRARSTCRRIAAHHRAASVVRPLLKKSPSMKWAPRPSSAAAISTSRCSSSRSRASGRTRLYRPWLQPGQCRQPVRGFEVDAAYHPVSALALTGAVTYLDPKYNSFTGAACVNYDTVRCPGESGDGPPAIVPRSLGPASVGYPDMERIDLGHAVA